MHVYLNIVQHIHNIVFGILAHHVVVVASTASASFYWVNGKFCWRIYIKFVVYVREGEKQL